MKSFLIKSRKTYIYKFTCKSTKKIIIKDHHLRNSNTKYKHFLRFSILAHNPRNQTKKENIRNTLILLNPWLGLHLARWGQHKLFDTSYFQELGIPYEVFFFFLVCLTPVYKAYFCFLVFMYNFFFIFYFFKNINIFQHNFNKKLNKLFSKKVVDPTFEFFFFFF